MDKKIFDLMKSLKDNGFNSEYFETREDVKKKIIEEISKDEIVAIGGSMTILDTGIYEDLVERGNKVYWHWKLTDEKNNQENLDPASTDVYLTSTNALTMDGKLVNMDGSGNRVASMFFGHERVYVIAGRNKICDDYEAAYDRIKNIAAPKNAKRLKVDTPCRYTGKCVDCDSPDRICNIEVVIHKKPMNTNIFVYIVNEDLGY